MQATIESLRSFTDEDVLWTRAYRTTGSGNIRATRPGRQRTPDIADLPLAGERRRRLKATTALCGCLRALPAVALGASLLVAPAERAGALPQGGEVVGGQATIEQVDPSTLNITHGAGSPNVAIEWQSFDVAGGEVVNFYHHSIDSATLNTVIGGLESLINGKINTILIGSNGATGGTFALVNPAGITFGPGANVGVGSIIASTIGIENRDFLDGHYEFGIEGEADARILNEGTINVAEGGLVALVAPGVENRGVINAKLGKVALASGTKFTLDFYGDGLVQIALDDKTTVAANGAERALVIQSGEIFADGGIVQLTANSAKGVVDTVINMSGVVRAQTVAQDWTGEIILDGGEHGEVQVAGTLDASGLEGGQTGGYVSVVGEAVELFEDALIDVSGAAGGGTAYVGIAIPRAHPAYGATPSRAAATGLMTEPGTKTADYTAIGADTRILADATVNGNGGDVVVWGDESTVYEGFIGARGGSQAGDGGFVEVSGERQLVFDGLVDTTAANGATGLLMIDPTGICVVVIGGQPCIDTGDRSFPGLTVSDQSIRSALQLSDVLLATSPGGTPVRQSQQFVNLGSPADDSIVVNPDVQIFALSGNNTLFFSTETLSIYTPNLDKISGGASYVGPIPNILVGVPLKDPSTVNLFTGGEGFIGPAVIDQALGVVRSGGTINVGAGIFQGFTVDVPNVTVRGAGNTTRIRPFALGAPPPPGATIRASGVTVADLQIEPFSPAGFVGVLLDGIAAPGLTGVQISGVDVIGSAIQGAGQSGILSQGDIGDLNPATVDVTIAGRSAADPSIVQRIFGNAIDLGDTNGNARYEIADVTLQFGSDIGIRFGAIAGATVRGASLSGVRGDGIEFGALTNAGVTLSDIRIAAGGNGIDFAGPVAGDTSIDITNAVIGRQPSGAVARVGGDGVRFGQGILGTSTVTLGGSNEFLAAGQAIDVNDLQSPSTLSITGGTYNGLAGALLIDNTGTPGPTSGRLSLGGGSFVGGAASTVVSVVTDTGNAGVDIDVTGAPSISGGATGLSLSGPGIDILGDDLSGITFLSQPATYISLANGAEFGVAGPTLIDIGGVSFNGTLGSAMTPAELVALEGRLDHALDGGQRGVLDADPLFVLQGESIQLAINAAGLLGGPQTVTVDSGIFDGFIIDVSDLTVIGAGTTSTFVKAASPAATVTANGATVQDMFLIGTDTVGEIGVLLDGTAATGTPNLTGVQIINVHMANLDDGVRSQGDIGDGNAATVDVTIRGNGAADQVFMEDFLDTAIDVGDTDGDAVYLVQDVIVRDHPSDAGILATGDDGMRFGAIGGATVNRVDISGAAGDGIQFGVLDNAAVTVSNSSIAGIAGSGINASAAVQGDTDFFITDNTIGSAGARVGVDGIAFGGGILDTATVVIGGTNQVFATGQAIEVDDLQSPTSVAITGGTYNGTGGALLVDNTGVAGPDGRLDVGAAAYVGGAGSTVFEVRTDAFSAGIDIDFSGAATFDGGATGIRLSGPGIDVLNDTLGSIAFTNQTTNFIELANGAEFQPGVPTVIDANFVTFDGLQAAAMTAPQLAAAEAKIVHFPDDNTLGRIDIDFRQILTGESIQRAVNAAGAAGGPQTLTVHAGTFGGSVEVWVDDLTLVGLAGATIDVDTPDAFSNFAANQNAGFIVADVTGFSGGAPDTVTGVTIDPFGFAGTGDGVVLGGVGSAAAGAIVDGNTFNVTGHGILLANVAGTTTLSNNGITAGGHGILTTAALSGVTVNILGNTIDAGLDGIRFAGAIDDSRIEIGDGIPAGRNTIGADDSGIVFAESVSNSSIPGGAIFVVFNQITAGSGAGDRGVVFLNGIEDSFVSVNRNTILAGDDGVAFLDAAGGANASGVRAISGNSTVVVSNNMIGAAGTPVGADGVNFEEIIGTAVLGILDNVIHAATDGVRFDQVVSSTGTAIGVSDAGLRYNGTVVIIDNEVHAGNHGVSFVGAIDGSAVTFGNNDLGTDPDPVGGDGVRFGRIEGDAVVSFERDHIEATGDGVSVTGGIFDTADLQFRAARVPAIPDGRDIDIDAGGTAVNVVNLQSPSTMSFNGGSYTGGDVALSVDNTGQPAGPAGRVAFANAPAFQVTNAGGTVARFLTDAVGPGLAIDVGVSAASFTGGATGMRFSGTGIDIVGNNLGSIAFANQTTSFVELAGGAELLPGSPTVIDATGVDFDGLDPTVLADALALEDRLVHYLDSAADGLLAYGPILGVSAGSSIQLAINAAEIIRAAGGTVDQVAAGSGTFGGNIEAWVDNLTITGVDTGGGAPIIDLNFLDPFTNNPGFARHGILVGDLSAVGDPADATGGPGSAATPGLGSSLNGNDVTGVTVEGFVISGLGVASATTGIILGLDATPAVTPASVASNTQVDGTTVEDIGDGVVANNVTGVTTIVDVVMRRVAVNGVRFDDAIDGGEDVRILRNNIESGQFAALFNDVVSGANTTVRVQESRLVSTGGVALSDGIAFNGMIADGADVLIESNTEIRGTDGIDVDQVNNASLRILTNTQIAGTTEGVEFDNLISNDAQVTVSGNGAVDGVLVGIGFVGGGIDGATVTIDDNNAGIVASAGHGIFFGNPIANGAVITIGAGNIIDGTGGSGVRFQATVTDSTIDIADNQSIDGTVNGIEFANAIGGTSEVDVEGETIVSVGDGIVINGVLGTATVNLTGNNDVDVAGTAVWIADLQSPASLNVTDGVFDGDAGGLTVTNTAAGPTAGALNLTDATFISANGPGMQVTVDAGAPGLFIDLSGGGNSFTGTPSVGLSGAGLEIVGNSLGDTAFNSVGGGDYITLANGALFDPGAPTLINGLDAAFDGIIPLSPINAVFPLIEAQITDFGDDPTLGNIFVGGPPVPTGLFDPALIASIVNSSNNNEAGAGATNNTDNPAGPGGGAFQPVAGTIPVENAIFDVYAQAFNLAALTELAPAAGAPGVAQAYWEALAASIGEETASAVQAALANLTPDQASALGAFLDSLVPFFGPDAVSIMQAAFLGVGSGATSSGPTHGSLVAAEPGLPSALSPADRGAVEMRLAALEPAFGAERVALLRQAVMSDAAFVAVAPAAGPSVPLSVSGNAQGSFSALTGCDQAANRWCEFMQ